MWLHPTVYGAVKCGKHAGQHKIAVCEHSSHSLAAKGCEIIGHIQALSEYMVRSLYCSMQALCMLWYSISRFVDIQLQANDSANLWQGGVDGIWVGDVICDLLLPVVCIM